MILEDPRYHLKIREHPQPPKKINWENNGFGRPPLRHILNSYIMNRSIYVSHHFNSTSKCDCTGWHWMICTVFLCFLCNYFSVVRFSQFAFFPSPTATTITTTTTTTATTAESSSNRNRKNSSSSSDNNNNNRK